jgi:hypothetical protein
MPPQACTPIRASGNVAAEKTRLVGGDAQHLVPAPRWRWPEPGAPQRSELTEPVVAQLLECFGSLAKLAHAHATQHRLGLGELNLAVVDDLDAVAPGITS